MSKTSSISEEGSRVVTYLTSKCIKMEVSKNEQVVDPYEKIYGDECRICLKRAVEICELFRNGDAIPRKLMAVASVQVSLPAFQ